MTSIDVPPGEVLRLRDAVGVILRWRHATMRTAGVLVLLVATVTIILPRRYSSVVAFVPSDSEDQGSQVAGLAAQFGIGLPMLTGGHPPDFYGDLAQSDLVTRAVAQRTYQVPEESRCPCTLVEYWKLGNNPPRRAAELAARKLKQALGVNTNQITSVVSVTATTYSPELSAEVAQAVLDEIDRFNQNDRSTRAAAEHGFLQARLREAGDSLRAAEDAAEAFLTKNRDFHNSPALTMTLDRLQRDIARYDATVQSLANSDYQARLTELRDTPQLSVVAAPVAPALPDPRGLILRSLAAAVAAIVLVCGWGLLKETALSSTGIGAGDDLEAAWTDFMEELRRPRLLWTRLRRTARVTEPRRG